MRKILTLSIFTLFLVGIVNADQWVRDDDSYFIYFNWTDTRPDQTPPGGYVFYDLDQGLLAMTAVRTNRGFNVYAMNNSPDAETGARIVNHSAYPSWYALYGWDVPDADAGWSNGTRYLLSLDTFQKKWWLFYVEYPYPSTKGVADIYVPMSGAIQKVEFNEDNTVDIYLLEENGDWKTFWVWGCDYVRLQDRYFVAHLDLTDKEGYIAPSQLIEKPIKD
jgi:hypothetical protein